MQEINGQPVENMHKWSLCGGGIILHHNGFERTGKETACTLLTLSSKCPDGTGNSSDKNEPFFKKA